MAWSVPSLDTENFLIQNRSFQNPGHKLRELEIPLPRQAFGMQWSVEVAKENALSASQRLLI